MIEISELTKNALMNDFILVDRSTYAAAYLEFGEI